MAVQWISCASALEIVGGSDPGFFDKRSLVNGAAKGQISSRATCYAAFDENEQVIEEGSESDIPTSFWNFDEANDLSCDWEKGDFEKVVLGCRFCASGVSFSLEDILKLVPFERRAAINLSHSVASNSEWISTQIARTMCMASGQLSEREAENFLLDSCKQALVSARAVLLEVTYNTNARGQRFLEREWNIVTSFWNTLALSSEFVSDWTIGSFSGCSPYQGNGERLSLSGVHLLKSDVESIIQSRLCAANIAPSDPTRGAKPPLIRNPPLSDTALNKWWESLADVRDSLSETALQSKIREKYPNKFVSRDRLRKLIGSRKRGPKPFRGKSSAN